MQSNSNDPMFPSIYEIVAQEMKSNDPSHDMFHVERVVALTKHIYGKLKYVFTQEHKTTMTLAALLHDIKDHKYCSDPTACKTRIIEILQPFVETNCITPQIVEDVNFIVENVSFSKEKKKLQEEGISSIVMIHEQSTPLEAMMAVVQDADRLDALGAIGIARCIAFASSKQAPFYDHKTIVAYYQEELQKITLLTAAKHFDTTVMGHFYVKLFHLESLFKTDVGKEMAKQRTQYMREYVKQLVGEVILSI